MTGISGAQAVACALRHEGIRFTFGIPGAQNLELYDCLDHSADIHPVLVTDERSAPFMAGGLALVCGQPGCVLLVPGAGLTHALSGIAEAYMDNVPLLILATGIRNDTHKTFQLHEIDQLALARPVTKGQVRIDQAVDLYSKIRMACGLARMPPAGPVIVEIPANLFIARQTSLDALNDIVDCTPAPPVLASDTDLQRAAAAIEQSEQPLLYLGRGSADGKDHLVQLAERLEAPVCTTFQGKSVFPEHHPLWLWPGFGPSAPAFVGAIARDCDLTLAIGCRFSEVATGSYGLMPSPTAPHRCRPSRHRSQLPSLDRYRGRGVRLRPGVAPQAAPACHKRTSSRSHSCWTHAAVVGIGARSAHRCSITAPAAALPAKGATKRYYLCDRQRQWPLSRSRNPASRCTAVVSRASRFFLHGLRHSRSNRRSVGLPRPSSCRAGGGRCVDDDRL
jgi:hypothetical protein